MTSELTPFEGKEIRKVWHDEQWYFSIIDVIEILTNSNNANRYWSDLKRKLEKESGQSYENIVRLNLLRKNGKTYPSDCTNTEGVFRIIMSVPSPKAEPLKLWLAEQGKRSIDEAENPELAYERMTEIYRAKGHNEKWIKERLQTIRTRNKLTDEWKNRGIKEGQEYSILTATIAKGTFGLTPSEHSELKGLEKQNLRDHMSDLELIFTALSEEATRQIAINDDSKGFHENHDAAVKGGKYAGNARRNLEKQIGKSVVSSENNLDLKGSDKPNELPTEK
jgi:DNA-damage-inducible protein D